MADPGAITQERLTSRYVGDDVAIKMADLYSEAKEWLKDWKEESVTTETKVEQPYDDSDYTYEDVPV
jgi:hypothetical protein